MRCVSFFPSLPLVSMASTGWRKFELADPPKKTGGGVAVLLTIVTLGIYGFYWAYKMGGLLDEALAKRSMPTQNRNVTYLILAVIQLGFVGWILMQSTINSMIPDEV